MIGFSKSSTLILIYDDERDHVNKIEKVLRKNEWKEIKRMAVNPKKAWDEFNSLVSTPDSPITDFLVIMDLLIDENEEGCEGFVELGRKLVMDHPVHNWSFIDDSLSYLAGYMLMRCWLEKNPKHRDNFIIYTGQGAEEIKKRLDDLGWFYILKGFGSVTELLNELERRVGDTFDEI